MNAEVKRHVTQAELDAAYAACVREPHAPPSQQAPLVAANSRTHSSLGIHLLSDRSYLVRLTEGSKLADSIRLEAGYDNPDELFTELATHLTNVKVRKLPLFVTLSGSPSVFFLTQIPRLPRTAMQKAFHLQLKQLAGEERRDLSHIALPHHASPDSPSPYVVASVDKQKIDSVLSVLRRAQLHPVAWDLDFLCFVRAADFLWKAHGLGDSTRFLLMMEWESCRLLIASSEGKILCPSLPIGVKSFTEKLTDAYVPFAQMVKTQLYSGCNEWGVPLPSHFAIVGSGARQFTAADTLGSDLALTPLPFDSVVPVDLVAAVGASLWEKEGTKFNFLPGTSGQTLQMLKETFQKLKLAISEKSSRIEANKVAVGLASTAVLLALCIFPIWNRSRTSRLLDEAKAERVKLASLEKRIKESRAREQAFDRKVALVKLMESKRTQLSRAVKEVVSMIPHEIRLESLSYRDNQLLLKGLVSHQTVLENFLRSALTLRLLEEPTLVNIKAEKEKTLFDVNFKLRVVTTK